MSDYKQTRDVSGRVVSRFSTMLKNLQDDYEDEIVVVSLMRYYDMCAKPDTIDVIEQVGPRTDEDLLWAIERVLADYMTSSDFSSWLLTRHGGRRSSHD